VAVEAAVVMVAGLAVAAVSMAAALVEVASTVAALEEAAFAAAEREAVSVRPESPPAVSAQARLGAVDFAAPSLPTVFAAAVSTTGFTTAVADLRWAHLAQD
jgi:hypothetical protein